MKYPDTKIECAAGKNDVRYYLNAPYLDTEKSKLIATNGHIVAVLPVELEDGDISGPVPIDALKGARKRANLSDATGCTIKLNGSAGLLSGESFPRGDMDAKFPDYERVIKDKPQADCDVAFNAKLLNDLVSALQDRKGGNEVVSLWFAKNADGSIDPTGPIRVEAAKYPERIGMLMPCRV